MIKNTILPPVRKNIEVATTSERAFRIFTADMHRWWPVCHEGGPVRDTIVVGPHEGGRWFERTRDGKEHPWGRVHSWNPPTGLVLIWRVRLDPSFDPHLETKVEIRFDEVGAGRTLVSVEHRKLERFGLNAEEVRTTFDGPGAWVGVLDAFRAGAQAGNPG